jgi:fumarylacetoacetase
VTIFLDETHDARLVSWLPSARRSGSPFPIQNLPLGVFRRDPRSEPRIGIAIGDHILDLHRAVQVGALALELGLHEPLAAPTLNPLLARGRRALRAVRHAASALLREDSRLPRPPEECLVRMDTVDLVLPVEIGDYTDFYASIHHATNVGRMLRPDQPLFPNYKWVPIGYHGRASSIVPSGTPVRRPRGQVTREGETTPLFRPSEALDFECEVGFVVGSGNPLGLPVPIGEAEDRLAGLCLLNDWSARDVQRWEYQPLGPFLAKNFATTISPWLVTLDGLEPFRAANAPRGADDPEPLPHLAEGASRDRSGFGIDLEVRLSSARMRAEGIEPLVVTRTSLTNLYWSAAQFVAHHTSNGCNLRSGDLLASGTVSGPDQTSRGCLLEITWRGTDPLVLPTGEKRRFLEDGDEVWMSATCSREGFVSIGFGECRGTVLPVGDETA